VFSGKIKDVSEREIVARGVEESIKKCLVMLEKCSDLPNDEAYPLCLVLRFTCLLFQQNNDTNLGNLISEASNKLGQKGIKILEMMGHLALQPEFERRGVALVALKKSFHEKYKSTIKDWDNFAQSVSEIFQLCLKLKDIISFCETVNVMLSKPEIQIRSYPKMHAKWLVTWLWNEGVVFHRQRNLEAAESLMSKALQFSKLLFAEFPHEKEFEASYQYLLNEMNAQRTTTSGHKLSGCAQ